MEEVSHKQIYDRLVAVESKVDKIDTNTVEHLEIMVAKDYWTTAHDLQPLHDAIAKG